MEFVSRDEVASLRQNLKQTNKQTWVEDNVKFRYVHWVCPALGGTDPECSPCSALPSRESLLQFLLCHTVGHDGMHPGLM